jgi:hypothetical protein
MSVETVQFIIRTINELTEHCKMLKNVLFSLALLCVITLSNTAECGSANFDFSNFRNVYIFNSMCQKPTSDAMKAYCAGGPRGGPPSPYWPQPEAQGK